MTILTAAVLTPRQLDILRLIAAGLPDKTIATRCRMSKRAVNNQCRYIYQRLGVINRVQAARWAWEQGLELEPLVRDDEC